MSELPSADSKHPARLAAWRSIDAVARGDKQAWLDNFADDAIVEDPIGKSMIDPSGEGFRGKAAIAAMLDQRFSSIPDMAWEIHSHWVGGDRGCSEWTVSGTESNGNRLNWMGCDLWVLNADGMITRKDTYWKYAGGE